MARSTTNGVSPDPVPPSHDGARGRTNSCGHRLPGVPYDASAPVIDDLIRNHRRMVVGGDRRPGESP